MSEKNPGLVLWGFSVCCSVLMGTAFADEPKKIPIILDTDIGTDVDDAFALGLVLASPELDLLAVTTCGTGAEDRAWMVCRFLAQSGRRPIPVAWGRGAQSSAKINWQIQYRRHPAVIFNRTSKPAKESAVELLYKQLKARPGTTLLTIGPMTNVGRLLTQRPDCKPWIKRIVIMAGSIRVGYNGKPPIEKEWNVKGDVKAAQTVFRSGIPLVVAPLDATTMVKLKAKRRKQLFDACTPLTYQIQSLYELWDEETPTLYDPVAVTLCFDERFCKMENLHVVVDDEGFTRIGKGKPNARVATSIKTDAFLNWIVKRLSAGDAVLPRPLKNVSKLVPQGGFPTRVHAFEDYETDIEKRWWMSGKLETKNVPPGSKRACRGVVTRDFDAKMGHTETAYSAVIFNPVPGPPMGPRTRLSFRYWLKGTDQLRVQLYSLSNGYHRYLSLKGLPQSKWQSATVDVTKMRRPDGSGGPLSVNERIDDIQFYVDPRAELIIDDVVLYEAAAEKEKRPFPQRILFSGWFDTGKQGREWPGDFEITARDKSPGYFWKAAKSVQRDGDVPWIRLHLRGERPLGEKTRLFFRYKLFKGTTLKVALVRAKSKKKQIVELKDLEQKPNAWSATTAEFSTEPGERVDEIHFLLPSGAELLLDDVLLYEP